MIDNTSFGPSSLYVGSVVDSHLTDCKFGHSILIGNKGQEKLTNLEGAITSIEDLQEKISQGEKFDVNYAYFKFRDMNLENADFPNSIWSRAKFINVNLNKANLQKAELHHAGFDNSSLIDTNLSDSDLNNSSFFKSDLKSAILENSKSNK